MDYFKSPLKQPLSTSCPSYPIWDIILEVADIVYCQSENNYTRIVLSNHKEKLISKTLKEVEQTLSNYLFMRIHQSYLINPNYLKKYHKNDGGYVVMEPDKQLPVSKSKKEHLIKLFEVISRNQ